jgi:hypothetical protein
MKRRGEDFDAVDEAGAGTGEVGVGVHGKDRLGTGQLGSLQQGSSRFVGCCFEVVAAGHEHHDLGLRGADRFPGQTDRWATGTGEQGVGTGHLDHLRYPVPTIEWGITPFKREHAGPLEPIDGGSDARQPMPEAGNDLSGPVLHAGDPTDLQHAVEDVVERAGVEGDDSA